MGIDTHQEPVVFIRDDCEVCRSEGFIPTLQLAEDTDQSLAINRLKSGLLAWASRFQPASRMVLVHDEPEAQDALAARLREEHGMAVEIPARGDRIVL